MPHAARNINTDGSMMIGDAQEFFDRLPAALKHYQHHEQQDRKRDGHRQYLNSDDQARRDRLNESAAEEGRMAAEYDNTGYPVTTDENGKRIAVDWRAPYRSERARLKAGVAGNALVRRKIGPNVSEQLRRFAATTPRKWRSLEIPPIADERNPGVIVRERESYLDKIAREEIDVQNANQTDAKGASAIRADYARRKVLGAPKFGPVLQGGTIRANGQFSPSNPGARPQYPTAAAMVHSGETHSIFVEVDDALNFAIWADDDEKILAKLLKAAREANTGKRQISEADKTKMLREIAVEKLAAQRNLEVAYRHAEAQGVDVRRRELPPEVLLWLERDTATRPAPTKFKAAQPVLLSDEPDFESVNNFDDDADESRDE